MRIVDKGTGDVMKNFFCGEVLYGLISLEDLKNNEEIRALFEVADRQLAALDIPSIPSDMSDWLQKKREKYLRLWIS